jgi:hypothetical protein
MADPAPVGGGLDQLRQDNRSGAGLRPGEVTPYAGAEEHLEDEIARGWLLVELAARRRWAAAPAEEDDRGARESIERRLRAAHARRTGRPLEEDLAGLRGSRERALRMAAGIESRIEATARAGRSLPLVELARRLRLSPRQRLLVGLLVALEVDPALDQVAVGLAGALGLPPRSARLLAELAGEERAERLAALGELAPGAPLRAGAVVGAAPAEGDPLLAALHPAPRVVALIAGAPLALDPALGRLAALSTGEAGVFPAELVERAGQALGADQPLVVILRGERGVGRGLLAHTALSARGRRSLRVDALALAGEPPGALDALARELLLLGATPLVAADDLGGRRPALDAVEALGARVAGPVAITLAGEGLPPCLRRRAALEVAVPLPDAAARAAILRRELPTLTAADAHLLGERHPVTGAVIAAAARITRALGGDPADLDRALAAQAEWLSGAGWRELS